MKNEIWILHGWAQGPGNQQKWQPLMDFLNQNEIEARFLEIPGLDHDLDEVWTLGDYTRWLSEILPKGPVNLLGHSFGGQLSVKFAAENPARINRLILIGPSGIKDNSLPAVLKRNFFKIFAKAGKMFTSSEALRKILYKASREIDYLNASPKLRETMKSVLESEILADIEKIKNPTLLIWGKHDKASPYKFNNYYRERVNGLVFVSRPDARHSPQFTEPENIAKIIANFLKESEK